MNEHPEMVFVVDEDGEATLVPAVTETAVQIGEGPVGEEVTDPS